MDPRQQMSNTLLDEMHFLRRRVQELEAADAERQRIAAALQEREEHLRLALEASHMGTWDWNILTGEVAWSRTQESVFGFAAGTFPGTIDAFAACVHPDDRPSVADALNQAIADASDYNMEFRIVWPYGSVHWVHARGLAFYDAAGSAIRMPGVAMDITVRKQQEEERRALERKLLEAQKLESLRLLAAGVAHDFNNFLTTILVNASLALRQLSHNTSPFEFVEIVQTAAVHAGELTRELLAYVGEETIAVQTIDLNHRIQEMRSLLQAASTKQVRLVYQLTPDLPSIQADPSQIRRVLLNVVMNAVEAIGDQPGAITLSTSARTVDRGYLAATLGGSELPEGMYVALEVVDSGPGIPEDIRAQIFDPFFTTKANGTGLGLAVVLGIVRSHNGTLTVERTEPHGTKITLLFPAA